MLSLSYNNQADVNYFQQCGILTSLLFSLEIQSSLNTLLAKTLIRLRVCAGWSEPLLDAHTTLLEISCWRSNVIKVKMRAKIRNRYNQAPHLTQYTNGKVTTSQLEPRGQPFPSR